MSAFTDCLIDNDLSHDALQSFRSESVSPFPPEDVSLKWYCIHTKPQREQQVARYFGEMLDLETYFPRLRQYRTIRRVRKLVVSPLFPRYLFCRFRSTLYRAVRFAPDVLDLVHQGERPANVPDTLIADLRSWAGEMLDATDLRGDFRPGDTVEIAGGPFSGLSAVILRASPDRERVAVLLSLLNCGAQVSVSRSQICRLE